MSDNEKQLAGSACLGAIGMSSPPDLIGERITELAELTAIYKARAEWNKSSTVIRRAIIIAAGELAAMAEAMKKEGGE